MNRTLLAEWAPQSGVMLTWPHGHGDWRPFLTQVEPVFIDIGRAVTQFEKLLVATYDEAHRQHVLQRLAAAGASMDRVKTFIVPSAFSHSLDSKRKYIKAKHGYDVYS